MDLSFRPYQERDFKPLTRIIRQTWHYDQLTDSKTAGKMAAVFLRSCLANQTFSMVALYKGTPVGIILGKNCFTHRCSIYERLRQIQAILHLYASREGRQVAQLFGNVSTVDQQLLKECKKTYSAELALFVVDSSYRGMGLGQLLYQAFLDYLHQEYLHDFYLFTDTSCNFAFYERKGMTRRCELKKKVTIKEGVHDMNFFIYDATLSN
ncbi:GNAT family N-acetyltransferase [Turicibacter sp. 1E2]|jgi:GNAT superfamily N-acetyltransferase|uniref:N-acetyltransferase GCN5 n=1 Tax=Turicibacter faecis TaxID=2963365 RepID=A0ABM8IIB3_9FIRM|nr:MULTISPECIES: GNAT family N-acetyltransferase [unclassified Turicibacter]MCU7208276.1 GNAT family N-acetyltransferase [Turicibacter sp. 1E2]NCE78585.1 GNAT family N-acetyltransferase [Turicibacter sp. TS3]BEH90976.1 N-acetyltransferase GCN5 [Turicibacter sp. TC023]